MTQRINNKADAAIKLILFLISPFIAFSYSLQNIKAKSSYIVFFLFCIFFGMAFTAQIGKSADFLFDGAVYRLYFESMVNGTIDYFLLFDDYVQFDEGSKDFFIVSLCFLLSYITNNYHVMFMVFAAIFAYFMLKSFNFLTEEEKFDASLSSFLLAAIFILSNGIFNINGARFWIAAWIGVYCIFQIFRNNNRLYFLLACIIPFIHVAFYFLVILLLTAYFTKKFDKFWIIMFVVSFFISNLSVGIIEYISNYLPTFISRTILQYTNESNLNRLEDSGFIQTVFLFLERLFVNIIIVLFYMNRRIIKLQPKAFNLYSFLIVLMVMVNFTMPIPSVGNRFIKLSLPIIAYIWLLVFKGKKYNAILYMYPLVNLFSFYKMIVYYMAVTDLKFYLMNPFYLIHKYLLS